MKANIIREIELANGVTAQIVGSLLKIKGPKGEVQREIRHPKVSMSLESNKIVLNAIKGTKREKTLIGSYEAHIINMIKGVQSVHTYKLKICSGHFPMSVTTSGQDFVIKNFLGESVPRKMTFPKGVEVKIAGTEIVVSAADIELAGITASKIENLCRITNRDRRIFQDGCYITQKAGKQ